jgi:GntR family transcriptional regulator, transcriptional repressor for pyruvate dehydrogenase complex
MAFHPSRVRRPREQVEEQIREAILSGAFRQGDKLPSETQLAEQFSVSRTTVREALRALASAGLISKVAGVAGGSFVRSVDHHALEAVLGDSLRNVLRLGSITGAEVHQMRELLEVPAAGLAAEHRTADDLERLATVLGREKGTTVEDPAVPELDISFHSAVAAASGNRVLGSVVAALHGVARPVERWPEQTMRSQPIRLSRSARYACCSTIIGPSRLLPRKRKRTCSRSAKASDSRSTSSSSSSCDPNQTPKTMSSTASRS